jgi:hypothetical protein
MRTEQEIKARIQLLRDRNRALSDAIYEIYEDWSMKQDHKLADLTTQRAISIGEYKALMWLLELNNDE